jgi:ABC-2 type transport system ATP-binding protein
MPVIVTEGLVKEYKGKVKALKGLSIKVEPGEIYGLLGRNGAGKTTLVKILLGIVKPTDGTARLLDQPAGTTSVRYKIGYLPEDHRFPEYHTGQSLLDFYGSLLGMPRVDRRRRIPELLELMGIAHRRYSKIRTYSKGMKQRLGMAQALLHNPQVLFLDEPTDGVDPVGRRQIREILQTLKGQNKTIFLNSHLLGEVENVSDRVGILELGNLVREGSVDTLTRQRGSFLVGLAAGQMLPQAELAALGYKATRGRDGLWEVLLLDGQDIEPVVDFVRAKGLKLRHLVEKRVSLEDIFMATVDAEAAEV